MAMKRNLESKTSEEHWRFVKRIANRVSQWPAWKQAQFRTIIGTPENQKSDQVTHPRSREKEETDTRSRQVA